MHPLRRLHRRCTANICTNKGSNVTPNHWLLACLLINWSSVTPARNLSGPGKSWCTAGTPCSSNMRGFPTWEHSIFFFPPWCRPMSIPCMHALCVYCMYPRSAESTAPKITEIPVRTVMKNTSACYLAPCHTSIIFLSACQRQEEVTTYLMGLSFVKATDVYPIIMAGHR